MISSRPAGRFPRHGFFRTWLPASFFALLLLASACRKDPVPEITAEESSKIEAEGGEWGSGEDVGLSPGAGGRIRVSPVHSILETGVEVSADGTVLRLPYREVDLVVAVASDDELELTGSPEAHLFSIAVENVSGGDSPADYDGLSYYRITKGLYAPGAAADRTVLQFRRKNMDNVYPEDVITVEMQANPVEVSGAMDFDNPAYSFDFGKYVDNELGVFRLPEGKEISVEFEAGEDRWIKLAEKSPREWRVLAGWRPNDPTADGRKQDAVLVVSDVNEPAFREEYTVSRRNYGLPVTFLHGVWWCKYNSMGNSMDFNDQILSSEDPAAASGQTLLDYLASASPEEYRELWQWAYIGDSGKGMKVVEKDGIPVMEGYGPANVNINRLPADALSPDGYELPSMEEFNRIFDGSGTIWMAWNGSYELLVPWNGHSVINRVSARKSGIQVGNLTLSDLLYVGLSSPDFPEQEPLVWYGPGAQWNDEGIVHSGHCNNILFSVHSPSGEGWYFGGNMGNLFAYKNGAGPKDTRILRFKKSDVEYIY